MKERISRKNATRRLAASTTAVLDTVLKVTANTNSCTMIYQPKAPAKLTKFSKIK